MARRWGRGSEDVEKSALRAAAAARSCTTVQTERALKARDIGEGEHSSCDQYHWLWHVEGILHHFRQLRRTRAHRVSKTRQTMARFGLERHELILIKNLGAVCVIVPEPAAHEYSTLKVFWFFFELYASILLYGSYWVWNDAGARTQRNGMLRISLLRCDDNDNNLSHDKLLRSDVCSWWSPLMGEISR